MWPLQKKLWPLLNFILLNPIHSCSPSRYFVSCSLSYTLVLDSYRITVSAVKPVTNTLVRAKLRAHHLLERSLLVGSEARCFGGTMENPACMQSRTHGGVTGCHMYNWISARLCLCISSFPEGRDHVCLADCCLPVL